MLENATVAISPRAPIAAKASPAVEYSNAANIACSVKVVLSTKIHSICSVAHMVVVDVSPTSQ